MAAPRIWLLSAYAAPSHRSWADWLVDGHPDYHWRRFELPGRHFRWRIRGNPLSWLDALPQDVPDRLIATSMVDLATLKGLHPRLASVPTYYYFHENQFAYPVSERQFRSVDPQMVQLYGALAADRLLFNSAFNRDSFLDGIEQLLARMPDQVPNSVRERLCSRTTVCPVPIRPVAAAPERDERLILWNHRWEYDKAPEVFTTAILELAERGIPFRLALLGARHHGACESLERLRAALPDRIVADGRVDEETYRRLLGQAAIAVSTARHEFQGLAMLEAASAGARPLVPDALCYPEQYPDTYRYPPGDEQALTDRLGEWLTGTLPAPVDVSAWHAGHLRPRWQTVLAGDPIA
ncbi:tRNA-queuosine alpha-mannosyltransferase domain-containing protein [Arhodomonas sp. AD133]|uniref:tRNA-queuosine alpha-mannosyltransferase domain-containing protein n=1 Tax=Arhodomonas sp. AD133 TaxID=3415009 RepID=UPI003EBB7C82